MGVLRGPAGEQLPLVERTLIGRSRSCDLRLDDLRVSGEHARLRWDGQAWLLADLASRNGTWCDAQRLEVGELRFIQGATASFGGPEQTWTLVDASAPRALARAGVDVVVAEDELLALPDGDDPRATIYRNALREWVLELATELRRVDDRELIEVAGRRWELRLPGLLASTVAATAEAERTSLAAATLELQVSRDREHIEAALRLPAGRIELGARVHHGVLLQLARERLADRSRPELAEADRGWMYTDTVCAELGLDITHLNILVHRIRRQLAQAGLLDPAGIVERRAGTGQLRLGLDRVIVRER